MEYLSGKEGTGFLKELIIPLYVFTTLGMANARFQIRHSISSFAFSVLYFSVIYYNCAAAVTVIIFVIILPNYNCSYLNHVLIM